MNTLIRYWLGIDVSKRKLDVALLDERGKIKSRVFGNDPGGVKQLLLWLAERGASPLQSRICMEATGPYSEASATALVDAGWVVSVVNPARVKGFAQGEMQRNKTDMADAGLLARFCCKLDPEPWLPAPIPVRELRALVERLQVLKDMHQQEANRLEAHGDKPVLRASIEEHLKWLQACAEKLQRQIDDHIDGHPGLKQDAALLNSIPGIGAVTAPKVLALLGDVRKFKNAKALSHRRDATPQRVRQLGARAIDDEPHGACRDAHCVVHAGTGGSSAQPSGEGLRRASQSLRHGTQGSGRRVHAQTGDADLRGVAIRRAVRYQTSPASA